jgi:hypothetical protein
MLANPSIKYRPFPPVALPERQWPGRTLQQAPRWCSSDLRDGNQALAEPMDNACCCSVGLKRLRWRFLRRRKPTLILFAH